MSSLRQQQTPKKISVDFTKSFIVTGGVLYRKGETATVEEDIAAAAIENEAAVISVKQIEVSPKNKIVTSTKNKGFHARGKIKVKGKGN